MILDYSWNDLLYTLVIGSGLSWSIHSTINDYFDRNFIRNDDYMCNYYVILQLVTVPFIIFNICIGYCGCVALAFIISGSLIWKDYMFQLRNGNQQRYYINRRRKICSLMTDERIMDAWLLLKMDNGFTPLLYKMISVMLTLLAVLLDIFSSVVFSNTNSFLVNFCYKILWLIGDDLGSRALFISCIIFLIGFLWRNSVELQTRRHILEYLVEVKDLKNKFI